MKKTSGLIRVIGVIIFLLGAVIGIAFNGLAVWADFESMLFDSASRSRDRLNSFSCPVLITTGETGAIKATFQNPLDRTVNPVIRFHSSSGFITLMDEEQTKITIPAGEEGTMEWTVLPENAVWQKVIFARVYQFSYYPVPARSASCGILVVDLPFLSGTQVVTLSVLTSFSLMAIGIGTWSTSYRSSQDKKGRSILNAMVGLGILAILGMFSSIFGLWILSLGLLIVCVLLLVGAVGYFGAVS